MDYYPFAEISVKNKAGSQTRFRLMRLNDQAFATVVKLPLVEVPEIETESSENGFGLYASRCTVQILNNYNYDYNDLFESATQDEFLFDIDVATNPTGTPQYRTRFRGLIDFKFNDRFLRGGKYVATLDFATGFAVGKDAAFYRENESTALDEVLSSGQEAINMHYLFEKYVSQLLCKYDDNSVYYHFPYAFEEWRFYIDGQPSPNVQFAEMDLTIVESSENFIDQIYGEEDKISEVLTDICQSFCLCMGYSQSLEKYVVLDYFSGFEAVNQSGSFIGQNVEVPSNGGFPYNITTQSYSLETLSSADIDLDRKEPKVQTYPATQEIQMSRESQIDTAENPIETRVISFVESAYYSKTYEFKLRFDTQSLEVFKVHQGAEPSSFLTMPKDLYDLDQKFFNSQVSVDHMVWLANLQSQRLFIKRKGLDIATANVLHDPVMPFIYSDNNTVHRWVELIQNPVTFSQQGKSIEIGPRTYDSRDSIDPPSYDLT